MRKDLVAAFRRTVWLHHGERRGESTIGGGGWL